MIVYNHSQWVHFHTHTYKEPNTLESNNKICNTIRTLYQTTESQFVYSQAQLITSVF